MNDVSYKTINSEENGQRLDNYLIRILKGVPKSHIYRIIRSGEVRINKKRAKPSMHVQTGDSIRIPPVRVSEEKNCFVSDIMAKRLLDSIIYEDVYFLVINKPAGIAVHGGSGLSLGIIEALRQIRKDLLYLELVHRLDRETSGCLMLAKKRSALRAVQALFAEREVYKKYWALLTHPWSGKKTVVVDSPLEKNTLQSGERMVQVKAEGKPSETVFKLLENYQQACWVEAAPKTGRTHQIRVHSAFLKHVIVGDVKYGGDLLENILPKAKLYLHARSIQFTLNEKNYFFQADLDSDFADTIKMLRARSAIKNE